jgi:hypothetical protein
MAKNTDVNVKLTGKITTKNMVYDFSDSNSHKIIFLDTKRKLEGKSFFSFNKQSSTSTGGRDNDLSKGFKLPGEFV